MSIFDLSPNFSPDAVAVFDSNFNQVFQNARPVRGEVIPKARLMDHPLESGQLTTDYKVILPLEIVLPVIVSAEFYRDTYQEIWQLWQNSELLIVQMRASSYSNMVIVQPPHEERGDMYDIITIDLRFRQVQVVQSGTNFAPADPTQADTQKLGEQGSYPVTPVANSSSGVAPQGIPINPTISYSSVPTASNPLSSISSLSPVPIGTQATPQTGSAEPQTLTAASSISSAFGTFLPIGTE